MPDALDTRAALRELVLMLADHTASEGYTRRDLYQELMRLNERMSLAAAPPPPARTVTRAQYNEALSVIRDWVGLSDERRMQRIISALDLRVADDTEAPRA